MLDLADGAATHGATPGALADLIQRQRGEERQIGIVAARRPAEQENPLRIGPSGQAVEGGASPPLVSVEERIAGGDQVLEARGHRTCRTRSVGSAGVQFRSGSSIAPGG